MLYEEDFLLKKSLYIFSVFIFGLLMCFWGGNVSAYADNPETAREQQWNVLVISIDPEVEYNGTTMRATEYLGLSLENSVSSLKQSIETGSNGLVKINITNTIWLNEYPKYVGFDSLTEEDFFNIFPVPGEWASWMSINRENNYIPEKLDRDFVYDYDYLIKKTKLVAKRNKGAFDAVWVFSIDPSSMWESACVGNVYIPTNGGFYEKKCESFLLYGLTFSRVDGAVESVGHSIEALLDTAFANTMASRYVENERMEFDSIDDLNMWEKFKYCKALGNEKNTVYGVGQIHYSPNSIADYDWNNLTEVQSYYMDFANNYPDIGETVTSFSPYSTYLPAAVPMIAHHEWWMSLIPHFVGRDSLGYSNNWWDYLISYDVVDKVAFKNKKTVKSLNINEDNVVKMSDIKLYVTTRKGKEYEINMTDTSWRVVEDSIGLNFQNNQIEAAKLGTAKIELYYEGYCLTLNIEVVCNHNYEVTKLSGKYATLMCKLCGDSYVCLNETEERTVGSTITLGKYEQNNNSSDGAESVKWTIIDKTDDTYLLISDKCLETRQYNTESEYVNWSESSLCKWLNADFYKNVFTKKEKSIISYKNGNNVWLLSVMEATKNFDTDEKRIAYATKKAIADGTWEFEGQCCWWLMQSDEDYTAPIVDYTGVIFSNGNDVSMKDDCVRPVISVRYMVGAEILEAEKEDVIHDEFSFTSKTKIDGDGNSKGSKGVVDEIPENGKLLVLKENKPKISNLKAGQKYILTINVVNGSIIQKYYLVKDSSKYVLIGDGELNGAKFTASASFNETKTNKLKFKLKKKSNTITVVVRKASIEITRKKSDGLLTTTKIKYNGTQKSFDNFLSEMKK